MTAPIASDEGGDAIAFLTDPDGTYIELTEGLDHYEDAVRFRPRFLVLVVRRAAAVHATSTRILPTIVPESCASCASTNWSSVKRAPTSVL